MRVSRRRWGIGIAGGLLGFYTVWHYLHGAFFYKGYGDFLLLLEWVRQWTLGGQFNSEWVYMYPPFFYVLNAPFAWMSNPMAVRIMLTLNHLFLGVCLALLAMALSPKPGKGLWLWLLLPLALNFRPLLSTLSMAKIELLQLSLLLGSLAAFQRRRPWITGGLVACAGMIKPLPLLLFLYFAWKREWRVVAAWGVAALAILSFCSLFIGPHSVWTYMVNLVGTGARNQILWYEDQSLQGAASRLFQPIRPGHVISAFVPSPFSMALGWGLRLLVLGWLGFLTRPRPILSARRLAGEWSITMAGMLLLSPFSRDYYAVFLLPAYLFLAHHLWAERAPLRSPGCWLGILSYGLVGQGFPLGLIERLPHWVEGADNFQVYLHYGIPTAGYCLLIAAFAFAWRRTSARQVSSQSTETFGRSRLATPSMEEKDA